MRLVALTIAALALVTPVAAHEPAGAPPPASDAPPASGATAHYIANAGVLVRRGEIPIVFDPLFDETFGIYEAVPGTMRRAMLEGEPPFDGIDAVFVSHAHDDHFSAESLGAYLARWPTVRLVAPAQAVAALPDLDPERVTSIDLGHGDPPIVIELGDVKVGAVRIPHAGWPSRHRDVQNVVFHVTLDGAASVLHLGDADERDAHYERHASYWSGQRTDMAFPPYWYFLSDEGRLLLERRVRATRTVGVHVPTEVPADRDARDPSLRAYDLFVTPGETRAVPSAAERRTRAP